MMGPQLAAINQARAYASVAANKDIAAMHNVSSFFYISRCPPSMYFSYTSISADTQEKQIKFDPSGASSEQCHHARAVQDAAEKGQKDGKSQKAAGTFDYQRFYETELEKKHKDK